jgi:hypothetical protein
MHRSPVSRDGNTKRRAVQLVGLLALHHFRRHGQQRAVQIEPSPFHMPQLARPQQQQRRQWQRGPRHRVAFVGHYVAQQGAGLLGVNDGMVPALHGLQRVAQIGRRVTLACTDGDAVPEHLPAGVFDAVRGFDGSTGFHTAQAGQQLGRLNLGKRKPAQPGESVMLKPDTGALALASRSLGFVHGRQPVAGDMLEGV